MRRLLIGCAATRQRVWSASSAAWGEGTSKWAEPERCRRGLGTFLAEHPFPPQVDATARVVVAGPPGAGSRDLGRGCTRTGRTNSSATAAARPARSAVARWRCSPWAGLLAGRALALGAKGPQFEP